MKRRSFLKLPEIDRLAEILDTRDPASEISCLERSDGGREMSPLGGPPQP